MNANTAHSSFGMQKYLWGNVPAIDLLNLKDNEADATEENFRLLFAGKDAPNPNNVHLAR